MFLRTPLRRRLVVPLMGLLATVPALNADSIKHSFFAAGGETRIVDEDGKTIWRYPAGTRDGYVLPNGNLLLAVSRNKEYPGGAVVEIQRDLTKLFEFKGTQSEVNTAVLLANGNILLTEAGAKPRILEVDRTGKIVVETPIQGQNTNHHMETRMTRKLPDGNYLVPQLLDKVVREYTPAGQIVWEFKSPEGLKDAWPFTAIRLPNGHTWVDLTHSDSAAEVDEQGKVVWRISNADLSSPLLHDPCGAQRLPNGNTVICSYGIGAQRTKLVEVTPEKKVVWTFAEEKGPGIHEVQILTTNGVPVEGAPLK